MTRSWTAGWSEARQAFVQHYETDVLDSSLLRMSSVGFISPTDPMWTSTLGGYGRRARHRQPGVPLRSSGLTRWAARLRGDVLAVHLHATSTRSRELGQLEKARITFEKMLTYANHLGLYSEEIALTGEQIGNFPQAFTHLALIDAGLILDRKLDRVPRIR